MNSINVCVYMCIYTYTNMIYINIGVYITLYLPIYIYTTMNYINVGVCMYIPINIYIYIHTGTHSQIHSHCAWGAPPPRSGARMWRLIKGRGLADCKDNYRSIYRHTHIHKYGLYKYWCIYIYIVLYTHRDSFTTSPYLSKQTRA